MCRREPREWRSYLRRALRVRGVSLACALRFGVYRARLLFEGTVAPSGLAVYTGAQFAAWEGDLLNGGLITQGLVRVRVQDGRVVEHEAIPIGRRIRDVGVAGDGAIWVVTEHEDGEVLRLTPARP